MSPHRTLPTLPLEILCQILEATDSLDDVLTLAKTGPAFLQAYQWRPRAIIEKVLFGAGHEYVDAQELADLQILYPRRAPPRHEKIPSIRQRDRGLSTLKLLAGNAQAVSLACRYFTASLKMEKQDPRFGAPIRRDNPNL